MTGDGRSQGVVIPSKKKGTGNCCEGLGPSENYGIPKFIQILCKCVVWATLPSVKWKQVQSEIVLKGDNTLGADQNGNGAGSAGSFRMPPWCKLAAYDSPKSDTFYRHSRSVHSL